MIALSQEHGGQGLDDGLQMAQLHLPETIRFKIRNGDVRACSPLSCAPSRRPATSLRFCYTSGVVMRLSLSWTASFSLSASPRVTNPKMSIVAPPQVEWTPCYVRGRMVIEKDSRHVWTCMQLQPCTTELPVASPVSRHFSHGSVATDDASEVISMQAGHSYAWTDRRSGQYETHYESSST